MAERTCVKVASLRKKYDKNMNLKKWLENPDNVYVGRRGRIFIDKEIFHYGDSVFKNEFTVKKYGLNECLKLYEESLLLKIKNQQVNLDDLRGKNLGCFCDIGDKCHIDILLKFLAK